MDIERLISDRALSISASGIRRVFDLGAKLKDPINLSIGQPDFPVPDPLKSAAISAIQNNANGYTVTQGIAGLRTRIAAHLKADLGWQVDTRPSAEADPSAPGLLVASGTSGDLLLAFLALLNPGDEVIFADPYFVMYPHVARMVGAVPVMCDTYPDFRLTAERVAPLITSRTKLVLLNTPSNPAGVVASESECHRLLELCRSKGVLLVSDEIYDEFTYTDAREPGARGELGRRCPSPGRFQDAERNVLLVRGFGKTYGCTGWRLGYAAGPRRIIEEMSKLQQYTFVCAPAPLQWGVIPALDYDMSPHIDAYQKRRDLVVRTLSPHTHVAAPGGAFYAFPQVPERLGLTATQFVEKCVGRNVLVIPGNVFSARDTHFRLSYATDERSLLRGLEVLAELMQGG
ncbi:MAG: aminotransferase class I/II-fold pyridoxal phosphate-dependent enzyme [Phycisphaerales bacterium]|nr:aminotransferase class I/II-fold pyridoxal phosphate-dependent enzyme [Phycisphaerales bacterium]